MTENSIYTKRYKNRGHFIFVTFEGFTFQPDSQESEPDVENMQVIGFSTGHSRDEAYQNLIHTNGYLLDTSFDEIWCIKIDGEKYDCIFSIAETKENSEIIGK